jgi:thiol-disulfide isomerase/thioredoxin
MKNIKHLLLVFLPVLVIFTFCQGMGGGYVLKGVIQNAATQDISLDLAYFDRTNADLGKAKCDANGNFEIKLEKPFEEGLYRLSVGAKRMYFILNGKEHTVEMKGDLNSLEKMDVQVTGSETFSCYANLIQDLIKSPLKSPEDAKAAIKKGCTPLMQAFLTTQLLGNNAPAFLDDFKAAAKSLETTMPASKYTKDFTGMIGQIEKMVAQQQGTETIKVGQAAPDISLPGPDGKTHSLSALKGKVVLLDFWASWCGPCRRENPHVVEMYHKYKSKGFEVYSVSLDGADPRGGNMSAEQLKQKEADGKQKWIAAIKQDGLDWDNHVSDLKHWASEPAGLYGVTAIPKQFLIDKNGNIVAINPRENLENEILKLF